MAPIIQVSEIEKYDGQEVLAVLLLLLHSGRFWFGNARCAPVGQRGQLVQSQQGIGAGTGPRRTCAGPQPSPTQTSPSQPTVTTPSGAPTPPPSGTTPVPAATPSVTPHVTTTPTAPGTSPITTTPSITSTTGPGLFSTNVCDKY